MSITFTDITGHVHTPDAVTVLNYNVPAFSVRHEVLNSGASTFSPITVTGGSSVSGHLEMLFADLQALSNFALIAPLGVRMSYPGSLLDGQVFASTSQISLTQDTTRNVWIVAFDWSQQ